MSDQVTTIEVFSFPELAVFKRSGLQGAILDVSIPQEAHAGYVTGVAGQEDCYIEADKYLKFVWRHMTVRGAVTFMTQWGDAQYVAGDGPGAYFPSDMTRMRCDAEGENVFVCMNRKDGAPIGTPVGHVMKKGESITVAGGNETAVSRDLLLVADGAVTMKGRSFGAMSLVRLVSPEALTITATTDACVIELRVPGVAQ